jgi:Ran GTPase-activating protein (RanGAP) involved in mRNA processing and transport
MQRFEAIYLRNLSQTKDYESLMDLDLSRNSITEHSVRYLADILKKFKGFRSINLSGLSKMKETGYVELARSLKENHSLQFLDLSKNSLSQNTVAEFFNALQENYVLSELRLDVKAKTMPFGPQFQFSQSYTCMSMYQVTLNREAIDL